MSTPLFLAEEELGRFGGGGGTLAPALTESVDVSAFSGQGTFDITTIGGISLSNFTHIQIKFINLVRSAGGSHMTMQLRQEGGAFADEAYRWMRTNISAVNVDTGGAFDLTSNTATTTFNGFLAMSSVNQPCPTHIRETVQTTSNGTFRQGMTTDGAFVHDAIRFDAGAGAQTWTSGTVVITGFRCKVGTLYSGTFSTTSNVDINLGNGEYIGDVSFLNTTLSADAALGIRPGTGGTYLSSGIYANVLDGVASSTTNTFGMFAGTLAGSALAGKYAMLSFFNAQTSAPFSVLNQDLAADGTDTNPQEIRGMMAPNATSYDQIRILPGSGTITSGTYFVQTYKPRQTILFAQALTGLGSPEVAKTGLKKNNASLIVVSSTDATRASSDAGAWIQFGNGGYATDYNQFRTDEATASGPGATTVLSVTDDTAKTGGAMLAVLLGLPQPTHTQLIMGMDMTSGIASAVMSTAGARNTAEAEDRFKVRNGGGGPNWSAGTLYAVGYSL